MKGEFGEPWKAEGVFVSDIYDRRMIAETAAIAARIVRCVNFCNGMTDEDIDYFMAHMDEDEPPTQ